MSFNEEPATYNWQYQKYIDLVENTSNPLLSEFQRSELNFLTTKIQSPNDKTFIDVGAGYGRVLPQLAGIAKEVIAVELDQDMHTELKRRAKDYYNVLVIKGNGNNLSEFLREAEIIRPVILSLQNSLGTWKGNFQKAIEEMRIVGEQGDGEVVISLFCQEGLRDLGIDMYYSLQELVGEPDLEKTDFENGIFRSKTGYRSKWWTANERGQIRRMLGGQIIEEVKTSGYDIIHAQVSRTKSHSLTFS